MSYKKVRAIEERYRKRDKQLQEQYSLELRRKAQEREYAAYLPLTLEDIPKVFNQLRKLKEQGYWIMGSAIEYAMDEQYRTKIKQMEELYELCSSQWRGLPQHFNTLVTWEEYYTQLEPMVTKEFIVRNSKLGQALQ